MEKIMPEKMLKMNLQHFAEVDDLDLDDPEELPEGEEVGGEEPPVIIAPAVTPPAPGGNLNSASWQNVVELMETQNARMDNMMGQITDALQGIREAAGSTTAVSNKVASALERMEAAAEAVKNAPENVDIDTHGGESKATEEPAKRSGPRWRRK